MRLCRWSSIARSGSSQQISRGRQADAAEWVTAVGGVVAIVAYHEVAIGWDSDRIRVLERFISSFMTMS